MSKIVAPVLLLLLLLVLLFVFLQGKLAAISISRCENIKFPWITIHPLIWFILTMHIKSEWIPTVLGWGIEAAVPAL